MLDEQQSKNKTVVVNQRDQRGVAPADSLKWGTHRWGLKEYKWKGGPSLVGFFGSLCRYKKLYPALTALVGPVL